MSEKVNKLFAYDSEGADISNQIYSKNEKMAGMVQIIEIWHDNGFGIDQKIGMIYAGEPKPDEGYRFEVREVTSA